MLFDIGSCMPRLLEPKLLLPKDSDVPTAMFPLSFPSVITTTLRHKENYGLTAPFEQKPPIYKSSERLRKGF
jgi:hypothetical protein